MKKLLHTILLSALLIGSQSFAQDATRENHEKNPRIQQLRAEIKEGRKEEIQRERHIRQEIRQERRRENQERRQERRREYQEHREQLRK